MGEIWEPLCPWSHVSKGTQSSMENSIESPDTISSKQTEKHSVNNSTITGIKSNDSAQERLKAGKHDLMNSQIIQGNVL